MPPRLVLAALLLALHRGRGREYWGMAVGAARAPRDCITVCPAAANERARVTSAGSWCKGRAAAARGGARFQPLACFCSGHMLLALPPRPPAPCLSSFATALTNASPC